jgi:hypothetical protein
VTQSYRAFGYANGSQLSKGRIGMAKLKTWRSLAWILCAILLTSSIIPAGLAAATGQTGSTSLSIELKVENGVVTSAYVVGSDGQPLELAVQPAGKTAEAAVGEIVKALADAGNLVNTKGNSLVITVSGSDEQAEELADTLRQSAQDAAGSNQLKVRTAFVTPELAAEADALGMSASKYLLMQYIAQKKGITLEAAIAQYGQFTISQLLEQFKDAKSLFEGDSEDGEEGLDSLTPEQKAALDTAFKQQKDTVNEAQNTFLKAFIAIRKTYRDKIKDIEKEGKDKDAAAIQASLDQLKAQMTTEYNAALSVRDSAVTTAKDAFQAAATTAGIPLEKIAVYINWPLHRVSSLSSQLNSFLKEFAYHQKEDKPDDKNQNNPDEDKDNPGKKDDGSASPDHQNGNGGEKDDDQQGDQDDNGGKKNGNKQGQDDSGETDGKGQNGKKN